MEAPDRPPAQFSRQKCHQTKEGCSPPESGQIHPAQGVRRSRPACRHVPRRRQCLRLPGLPEQALRPWVRLQDKEFATVRSFNFNPFQPRLPIAADRRHVEFGNTVRYFFFTLPGGGSLIIAQNTPSSLMAFTNSWKSTGFTTYALTPSS